MLIKNDTIYSNKLIRSFFRVYYFDKIRIIRIVMNILIIIMIIRFFSLDVIEVMDFALLVFSLFGIIELNTDMIPYINYKRMLNRKDSIINMKIKYLFKEYNFVIDNKEYINYKDLYSIIESRDYYYIYINKYRVFIVDKTTISRDDIIMLSNNFKDKVSTYKYINYV